MKNSAYTPETQTKRIEDFYEFMNDLLDESGRALEEDDIAWCAVVHRLLIPVAEREITSGQAAPYEAPPKAA